ncbi:hypothetical protein [Demequina pelophila]|uniref:hypothetical protein n=1 Tax=Demequina pelophila TaxID=1638984 RepID=UPI000782A3CC|nr:hypothetical protein [Demequina pelophila]
MLGPQLVYYAADRAGQTAVIETATGRIAAWIVRDGEDLRAQRGGWRSRPVETVPQAIREVGARESAL